MTREEFDAKLTAFETKIDLEPDDIKNIILDFINFLQDIIKSEKVDEFLEKIEDRIEEDKFGLFAALIAAIKGTFIKKSV